MHAPPTGLILRQKAAHEEFDYVFLMSCLASYSHPRDKISRMIRDGDIIRVKKGLYVFSELYRRGPYSREALANLIYGPSCISLEYALAFYGLIPERVETVTSVTSKRNKTFATPVGNFTYRVLPKDKYAVGVTLLPTDATHHVLIATREKAIADLLWFARGESMRNESEVAEFLTNNIRMESADLKRLNRTRLREIAGMYGLSSLRFLIQLIGRTRHA